MGLCIGSFGGVLAYRIPRRLDFVKGRSFCAACGHTLAPLDLVPVLSYLCLRGRCRYCGAHIPIRALLTECAGGVYAALAAYRFGWSGRAAVVFFGAWLLTVIALIDHDTQEIPDGLTIALGALGVAAAFLVPSVGIWNRVIGVFAVSVPMLLINLLVPTSFGFGDIKLVAAAGFLLGWRALLVGAFLALVLGGGYGVYVLATKKLGRKDHFAFGPALAAGLTIALYFGDAIALWYLRLMA